MIKEPVKNSPFSRFIETARTLGADEDEAVFKAKLEKIARQQPQGEPPEKPKPKKGNAGI